MKPFKGWRYLLGCTVLVFLSLLVNEYVASSAPAAGFVLPDARYVVLSSDFGRFWRACENNGATASLRKNVPLPLREWELRLRLATGIRPTPERWRLWLGRHAVYSADGQGSVLSFYPGLFLRMLDRAWRVCQGEQTERISGFGPFCYAWKEGFLLVSTSSKVLENMKMGELLPRSSLPTEDAITFKGVLEPTFQVTVAAREGFPFEGSLGVHLSPSSEPLRMTETLNQKAILRVVTSRPDNIRVLCQFCVDLLSRDKRFARLISAAHWILDRWGLGRLRPAWDSGILETRLVLLDFKKLGSFFLPDLLLTFRCAKPVYGEHPLEPLIQSFFTLPMEWEGESGIIAPLWTPDIAFCLGKFDKYWHLATFETTLGQFLSAVEEGSPVDGDVSVEVNYERLCGLLQTLLEEWADFELLPGISGKELRSFSMPWVKGIAEFGSLHLKGTVTETGLLLKGYLITSAGM